MRELTPWILAARPKTLPAAAVPVAIGSALAATLGGFAAIPAVLCLVFAILIQIGTNFANDYFDYRKGADRAGRIGPTRAVAAGLISPRAMLRATVVVLALAFVAGLGLLGYGGPWLLLIGISSVLLAVGYTAGPFPLAYLGLGDVFVILYFGLIAVAVTAFVQTGYFSTAGWLLGLGAGLFANNLLVVNNHRDAPEDALSKKRTLAVRFGRNFSLLQYRISGWVAIGVTVAVAALEQWWPLLAVGLLAVRVETGTFGLRRATSAEEYGAVLGATAKTLLLYGAVIAGALLLVA